MEATRLSTRGQVVIPKELREIYRWKEGQELEVIDTGDGVLLRARKARQVGSWGDVIGCLSHYAEGKPPVTDEQMEAAIRESAVERYRRSLEKE